MGSIKWSAEETAVLIYFASRNAGHEGCSKIVGMKCRLQELRTANAVRQKLLDIRENNVKLYQEESGWDFAKVDEWLVGLGIPKLDALLEVGIHELQAVAAENRKAFMDAVFASSILNHKNDSIATGHDKLMIQQGQNVPDKEK